jgi:O-antigen/teichoic acid export membrane protein
VLREAIQRLSKHTLTYAAAEQASRLAGFLLLPWITSPEGLAEDTFGTRELIAVSLTVLSQVAGINLADGMSRLYFDSEDVQARRRIVGTTLATVSATAGLLALLLWVVAPQLAALLPSAEPGLPHLLRLALGILVFQVLRHVQNRYLQVQQRSTLFGVLGFSKLLVEITLQLVFLLGLGRGLQGLLEAVLLSEALFCAILTAITVREMGLAFSPAVFGALWAYALPLVPNGIGQFCLHSMDRYLVSSLRGEESLGLYALAYKLGYMPNYLLLGPFLLIWYPYVFSIADESRQRWICSQLVPYFMAIMTGLAVALSLFAPELARLAAGRPGYHACWTAIPWIAFGYWFWALFQLVQTGFFVRKRTRPLPWITGAAVLVNLALNLVLIPRFDFLGAAIATALTFPFLLALTERAVRPVFPLDIAWRRVWLPLLAGAVTAGAGLALAPLAGTWAPLAKLALVGCWLVWAWAGGFLRSAERQAVREALGQGSLAFVRALRRDDAGR